jgi:hypothetical protein
MLELPNPEDGMLSSALSCSYASLRASTSMPLGALIWICLNNAAMHVRKLSFVLGTTGTVTVSGVYITRS